MTLQISTYTLQRQAEVIAEILGKDGAMRLYEGEQRPLTQRTDGRLCDCKIVSATVEGGTVTIKWESAPVTKDGNADFFRLVSGNVPVISGTIGEGMEMEMSDTKLVAGNIINAGMLVHKVMA